jgi:integrase
VPIRRHGRGYEVRIQHGGRRISKTVATRADAQYVEAKLRQRIHDTRAGRTPTYSLEEAFVRWLNGEASQLKSKESLDSVVRRVFDKVKGRPLHEIVDVAAKVEEQGRKDGLLPATINRRLAVLRRVAKLAYRKWGWLENDLGAKIQLLGGERKRSRYLTQPEAKRLIAAASGPMREALRWFLLTGLRRGEFLKVTPGSFRDRHLLVEISKSGKPRAIPLPAELEPRRFPYGLNETALERGFREARSRAGLEGVWLHDLRRTYGTWLLQNGASLAAIRDLLGHSDITMTSRYLGTTATDLKAAVKALDGISFLAEKRRGRKRAA